MTGLIGLRKGEPACSLSPVTRKGRSNPLPENPTRNKGFFIDLRSLGECAEVSPARFLAKPPVRNKGDNILDASSGILGRFLA